MTLEKAFLQYLTRFGEDVQVTTRTSEMEEDLITEKTDDEGQPIFIEDLHIIKVILNILQGNERIIENAILKPGDSIGLFQLSDSEYLNTDSYVYIEYPDNQFNFKIVDIIPKKTHLKVLMKRDE